MKTLNLVIKIDGREVTLKTLKDVRSSYEKLQNDLNEGIRLNLDTTDIQKDLATLRATIEASIKSAPITLVLNGRKEVIDSVDSIKANYYATQAAIAANPFKTSLDKAALQRDLDSLDMLSRKATTLGLTFENALSDVDQKFTQLGGNIYKTSAALDATGASVARYEQIGQKAASGFNPVSNSVNQLARELPVLAISTSTFFLAISNNLPIFFDAMQGVNGLGNKFKELGKALFSPAMGLNLLVLGLTLFGGKIVTYFTRPSEKAMKAALDLKNSMKGLADSAKAVGDSYKAEASKADILFGALRDVNTTNKERIVILSQINKEYDSYLTSLGIETVTIENQVEAYARLEELLFRVSIAKAATQMFTQLQGDMISTSVESEALKTRILELRNQFDNMLSPKAFERVSTLVAKGYSLVDAYRLAADQIGGVWKGIFAEGVTRDDFNKLLASSGNELTVLGKRYGEIILKSDELEKSSKATAKAMGTVFDQGKGSKLFGILDELTKGFQRFFKFSTNAISGGSGSSATKKAVKDYRQFGDNVLDISRNINELLAEDLIDPDEYKKGLKELEIATDKYLRTIKGNTTNVNNADAENVKLNAENLALIQEQAKAKKKLLDETMLLFTLLEKGNGTDNQGRMVIGTDSNDAKKAKALIQDIVDRALIRQITLQEGIAEIQKRGVTLAPIEANQKIMADLDKEMEANRKKIDANQAIIDKGSGDDLVRERRRLEAEKLKIENDFAKQTEKIRKFQAQKEIEASDDKRKAEIAAGLDDFDKYTGDLLAASRASNAALIAASTTAAVQANKLVKDVVKANADGTFAIDFDAYAKGLDAYAKGLTAADIANGKILESQINIIEDNAANIVAAEIKKNQDIKNASEAFVDEYIKIYRDLNSSELRMLAADNNFTIQEIEYFNDRSFEELSKQVDKRRGLNKKQSEEEIKSINYQSDYAKYLNRIAFEKTFEIEIKQNQRQLDLAAAKGADISMRQKELNMAERNLQIQHTTEQVEIHEMYYDLIDQREIESTKDRIDRWAEVIKAALEFGNVINELMNQNSQNMIDDLNKQIDLVEQRSSDALSRIASLEDDLEGKRSGRREAVLQALDQQRDIEERAARDKLELMRRIEEEEVKIRKREQLAAIANAIINGAIAQTNIWATVPKADFGVSTAILSGISAATTTAQVAVIASKRFADGGFTGAGTNRDETGHKVAGVVHNDEWVAPKWMVESPKFGGMISQLENIRLNGFAKGGFTSPDFYDLSSSVDSSNNKRLESMMKSYMETTIELANRPIYTKATEVVTMAVRNNQRRTSITI